MKLLKPLLLAALGSVGGGAAAGIYKTVDEHGNVVFSDEPSSGATPVELPPITTYSAPGYRSSGTPQAAASKVPTGGYARLEVQQPERDATLRDNTGAVTVVAAVEPQLGEGHRLQFYLDGRPAGEAGTSSSATLSDVERGAHQVSVAVVDAAGREVKRSDSITFYLHRQSINFPTGAH